MPCASYGLDPAEGLFVDDASELVTAAIDLGYHGRLIDRAGAAHPAGPPPAVRSLVELVPLFVERA